MGRIETAVLTAFTAIALTPALGSAQTYYSTCGFSDPGSLRVCASSEVSFDGTFLTMKVWNREAGDGAGGSSFDAESYGNPWGGWHTITGVGLRYMGGAQPTVNLDEGIFFDGSSSIDLGWEQGENSLQLRSPGMSSSADGHDGGIVGCSDPLNNPNDPGADGSVTHYSTCGSFASAPYAQFTFSGLGSFDSDDFEFVFRSQQIGPNNEWSAKGTEVVPEPATVALLATGLLGLGLVAMRRREEDDELA